MADTHTHSWEVMYSMTVGGVTETKYKCETCDARKTAKGKPKVKRPSNMGGEFSTNWRP